jgi:hypothetical protein
VVPLDRPWKGHQPLQVLIFFIFSSCIFEKSAKPLQTKIPLILLFSPANRFDGHKLQSFPPNRSPKIRKSQQLFFGLRFLSRLFEEFQHPEIHIKIVQIFSSNISVPANMKKGFYSIQAIIFGIQQLKSLRILNSLQKFKIKKFKNLLQLIPFHSHAVTVPII